MFRILAVIGVVASVSPAVAQQSWVERRNQTVECENIRTSILTLVDKWNGKLWYASTDNNRDGYLNPSVVIAARQRVQDMVQAYDWHYTAHIRSAQVVNVDACKAHATNTGMKIGTYIDSVLKSDATR